jgi:hypothetical protein
MISTGFDSENISYFEAGDSGKSDSIVKKAIDKIRKIFETIKNRITEFFDGQRTKNQVVKLEAAMKKDPSLKNKKVKIPDTSKEDKLIKDTENKLKHAKSKDEVNKIMEDYRKKKKEIVAGAAVVTVTVAAVAGYLLHGKNKEISALQESKNNCEKEMKALSHTIEEYKELNKTNTEYEKALKKHIDVLRESNDKLNDQYKTARENYGVNKEKLGLIQVFLNSYSELNEDQMIAVQRKVGRIADSTHLYTADEDALLKQSAKVQRSIYDSAKGSSLASSKFGNAMQRMERAAKGSADIATGQIIRHPEDVLKK